MKVLALGLDEITLAFLRKSGFVVEAQTIEEPDELAEWLVDNLYDVAVLDLDKTRLGIYAARALRGKDILTPVVGISRKVDGRTWGDHRAMFLENGGDDLLLSPTNPRELAAVLRAVTRRFQGGLLNISVFKNEGATLKINLTTRVVRVNDTDPGLTGRELALLLRLAESPGRVVSKERLILDMYSASVNDEPELKIIDVFVCKIREKLKAIHTNALFITTVWGQGYCLSEQIILSKRIPVNH